MKEIDVFHCSPDEITEFIFRPELGVHFGGIFSALEAGIRKTYNVCGSDTNEMFIHKCKLLVPGNYLYSKDQGGVDGWADLIKENKDVSVIRYENQYEPDVVPSWLVLKPNQIEHYQTIPIRIEEAEKLLEQFQDGIIHSISI